MWPFTQIGAAAFARGRAYYGETVGDKADADLRLALEFTSDSRVRMSIIRTMGHNCETVLKNDDLALETYRTIASSKTSTRQRRVLVWFTGSRPPPGSTRRLCRSVESAESRRSQKARRKLARLHATVPRPDNSGSRSQGRRPESLSRRGGG